MTAPEDWESQLAERDAALDLLTKTTIAYRKAANGRLDGIVKIGRKLKQERAENKRLCALLLELDGEIQRLRLELGMAQREVRVAWALANEQLDRL